MGTTSSTQMSENLNNFSSTSQSTESGNNNLDSTLILDTEVSDKINKINTYIDFFNKNDTKSLLSVIKEFQQKTNSSYPNSNYNFDKIESFVVDFHQNLQKQLDMTGDRSQINDILNNDETLKKYLENIKNYKTEEVFKDLMTNDTIKNNGMLQTNIKNILNNINNMNVKHKFFEYKYIQVNLFLIIFIQHVMATMQNFIEKVSYYSILRDAKKKDGVDALIKVLIDILNDPRVQLDPANFDMINDMSKKINKDIQDNQKKITEKINTIKESSFNDIVKFLYTNAFTDSTKQQSPPSSSFNNKRGGFVRSGSL